MEHLPARPAATARRAAPPEGYGTEPQEAVIRDIITDELTDVERPRADRAARAARRSRSASSSRSRSTPTSTSRRSSSPTSPSSSDPHDRSRRLRPLRDHDRRARRRRRPAALERPGPPVDVPVELAVEIGRTRMTIGETLALGPGLDRRRSTAWPASPSTCWSTASRSPAARSSSSTRSSACASPRSLVSAPGGAARPAPAGPPRRLPCRGRARRGRSPPACSAAAACGLGQSRLHVVRVVDGDTLVVADGRAGHVTAGGHRPTKPSPAAPVECGARPLAALERLALRSRDAVVAFWRKAYEREPHRDGRHGRLQPAAVACFPFALVALFVGGRSPALGGAARRRCSPTSSGSSPTAADSTLSEGVRRLQQTSTTVGIAAAGRRDLVRLVVLGRAGHRVLPHLPLRVPDLGRSRSCFALGMFVVVLLFVAATVVVPAAQALLACQRARPAARALGASRA